MQFSFGDTDVQVNMPTEAALLEAVDRRFSAGDGFALATINLDHLAKLSSSDAFRMAYAAQDFVVADGNPVVWLARLAGQPVGLVPGCELVEPLARHAAAAGIGVAFVGSTDAALAAAADVLQARIPDLDIVARIAPPMGFDPAGPAADEILAQLDIAGAGMVFLALGAPKQEIMAARARRIAPQIGFASIGAGLDFLAGRQRRAPRLFRVLAMEWLWRLLGNPRRLAWRYVQCLPVLMVQAGAALRHRRRA